MDPFSRALLALIALYFAFAAAQTAVTCDPTGKSYAGSASSINYMVEFQTNDEVIITIHNGNCPVTLSGGYTLGNVDPENATISAVVNSCQGSAQGGCPCTGSELGTYTAALDCSTNPDRLSISFGGVVVATLFPSSAVSMVLSTAAVMIATLMFAM